MKTLTSSKSFTNAGWNNFVQGSDLHENRVSENQLAWQWDFFTHLSFHYHE